MTFATARTETMIAVMSIYSASEAITHKRIRQFFALILVAWVVLSAHVFSRFAQAGNPASSFTELSADKGSNQISGFPVRLTFALKVYG